MGRQQALDMRKNITRFWSEVDDEKNRRILDAYFHNFIFYITCAFSADYFFSVRNISYPIYFAYTACSKII